MNLFQRKSKWEKLVEPVSRVSAPKGAKSGLAALSAFVGMSIASAAISAVRQRKDNT